MEVKNINKSQDKTEALINENIKADHVLVIDQEGTSLGIKPIQEALNLAYDAGLDLVCVAPQAQNPVCRLIDYQKYRFEQQKRAKLAKKNQTIVTIKEVRLSPVISIGDFETKYKAAKKFLEAGDKVKVTLTFNRRARMLNGGDPNIEMIERFIEKLSDISTVESKPTLEGRNVIAVLAQKKDKR